MTQSYFSERDRRSFASLLKGGAATALAIAALGINTGAHAQDANAEAAVEEVIVTGSRIKSANIGAPSPVTSLGAAEFQARGIVQTQDLLQILPQTVAANGDGDFGGNGVSNVDLRGLGEQRTLVLVDGRRLPFGQSNNVAPDINQIPGPLVQRVDVTTGGGSAVYGADAVAGVVNFIMKRDFEGLQIDGQIGINQTDNDSDRFANILEESSQEVPGSQLDGFTWNTSILVGANTSDGRGNVTAFFNYRESNEVLQRNRIQSACAFGGGDPEFFCLGSSTTRPARITDFGLAENGFDLVAFDENTGVARPFIPSGVPNDTFNFAITQAARAPSERFNFNVFSRYELTDKIELYLDLAFSDSRSRGQIGPSGNFFVTNQINCDNPFLSPEQLEAICTNNGLSGSDVATAFVGRRNVEGGPRQFQLVNQNFRISGGFRGDLSDSWSYDVFGQYARVTNQQTRLNDLITPRLQRSLLVVNDENGNPVCQSVLDGSDPACVPWNIFQPGGITEEALNYISAPTFENGDVRQEYISANVSGDLSKYGFKSPWAETGVQVVAGFEYRNDALERRADEFERLGQVAGNGGGTPPVDGIINVYEFYSELAVPILEGKEFAEELSVTAAYRFSDYNTTGTSDTYAFGLTWQPVSDIRFRAQYQRATRAPNIFELFFPRENGLFDLSDPDGDGVFDPCAGATPSATFAQCANTGVTEAQFGRVPDNPAGQFNEVIGGNPDLDVETSDTYTVGLIFTPSFIDGLSLSVDYYDIEVEDFIGTIPPQLSLQNCLETGDPAFCSLIQRDAGGSLFVDGATSFIVATDINAGTLSTDGIDANFNYTTGLGDWGNLTVNYAGTYVISFEEISIPGEEPFECAGFYASNCEEARPEYAHRAFATWSTLGGIDTTITWRHVGGVTLFGSSPDTTSLNRRLGAQNYIDVGVGYNLTEDLRLRAGINNFFDNRPPVSSALPSGIGTGNTFPSQYETTGRFAFFGVTANF